MDRYKSQMALNTHVSSRNIMHLVIEAWGVGEECTKGSCGFFTNTADCFRVAVNYSDGFIDCLFSPCCNCHRSGHRACDSVDCSILQGVEVWKGYPT